MSNLRVAIAHDYLTQRGGAERVVLSLAEAFPNAPIFTACYDAQRTYPNFRTRDVRTSWVQSLPPLRRDPRMALPVLAGVWERMRFEDYDCVVVSSSGWAHLAQPAVGARKVVYCHNPPRWLHQPSEYVAQGPQKVAMRALRGRLSRADLRAARSADLYLANSSNVASRISAAYGITAAVLHPPTNLTPEGPHQRLAGVRPGYVLTVARGRSYKNVHQVVAAMRGVEARLIIVGQASIPGQSSNVLCLPSVSDPQLRWLYANARALVTVAKEDFGLTPVEAAGFGTPTVAIRAGGFLESVADGVSGILISNTNPETIQAGLRDSAGLDEQGIVAHAANFSKKRFIERIQQAALVARAYVPQSLTFDLDAGTLTVDA